MRHKAVKIRKGKYLYRGYTITCVGYYEPEHRRCWEAEDEYGGGFAHSYSLQNSKRIIDEYLDSFKTTIPFTLHIARKILSGDLNSIIMTRRGDAVKITSILSDGDVIYQIGEDRYAADKHGVRLTEDTDNRDLDLIIKIK